MDHDWSMEDDFTAVPPRIESVPDSCSCRVTCGGRTHSNQAHSWNMHASVSSFPDSLCHAVLHYLF